MSKSSRLAVVNDGTPVLVNSGWRQAESRFGCSKYSSPDDEEPQMNGNGDLTTNGDGPRVKLPNALSKCTYQQGVTSYADSPHRHLIRPTDQPKLKILPNILYHVGNTPLVRINRIGKSEGLQCEILAKCEFFNAGGSIKDRIAVRMIEDAEASGRLKPGDTLIEPTSGNTGIGMVLAAAIKGYRCIIVMPEKMSKEKVDIMRSLGAEIVRTPTTASYDSDESHIGVAQRLLREIPRSHILDQYANPSNPLAHYEGTAEEILEACDGKVDMFVAGTGTGGTLSGVAMKLKERNPDCKIIGIDPLGSVIAAESENATNNDVTLFEVEGIGYDFVPTVSSGQYVDKWYKSEDKPTFQMARRLIREEGLLCGGSSGAAMYCALKAVKEFNMTAEHRVVVILPDSVRNYMSRFLNDDWMMDRHYLTPEGAITDDSSWWQSKTVGDLKLKAPMTVHPTVTVNDALQLLHREGFDQVPVIDDKGDVTGMVTLGNTMSLLTKGKIKLEDPVGNISYKQFKQVTLSTKLASLSVVLNIDHYAVVVHDQKCYVGNNSVATRAVIFGIATRINLLEFIMRGEHSAKLSANATISPA